MQKLAYMAGVPREKEKGNFRYQRSAFLLAPPISDV